MFNTNSCVSCLDSISDPICRECYIKQITIFLNDLNLSESTNNLILKKIKNRFPTESLNDTKCISCGKEEITICRYCFSIILKKVLRDLDFSEDVIRDFGYNYTYEEDSLEKNYLSSSPDIEKNEITYID